jgi:hypothetical protein
MNVVNRLPEDLKRLAYAIGAFRAGLYACAFIAAPFALADRGAAIALNAAATLLFAGYALLSLGKFKLPPTAVFLFSAQITVYAAGAAWAVTAVTISLGLLSFEAFRRGFQYVADEARARKAENRSRKKKQR